MRSKFSSLSAPRFLRSQSNQKRGRRRKLEFERLEIRNLLAGGIYLDPSTGDLTLWGDDTNNTGEVVVSGSQYLASIDSLSETFAAGDVNHVVFIGLGGDDTFRNGTAELGTLLGNAGNDTLYGGQAADLVNGGEGDNILFGGAGDDTLVGLSGTDTINGDAGNDTLIGEGGGNVMSGGGGDDLVFGGDGGDTMDGGDGLDVLVGFEGDDVIKTGLGGEDLPNNKPKDDPRDIVFGLGGNDHITGGGGLDDIYAGDGDDTVIGGSGLNRIFGQQGKDTITGGNQIDYLSGGTEDDDISGNGGDDYITGGNDNDVLRGGAGTDRIMGGWGDDSLYGQSGEDQLFGEGGNDGLFGGVATTETLNGGTGADRFINYYNADIVADLNTAAGDSTINFVNSGSSWTDKDIEVIDIGLRQLHHRTGSTLVFRDPLDSNPMTLTKTPAGSLGNNVDGKNSLSWSWTGYADGEIVSETYSRKIEIADWNANVEEENNVASLTVIHEIGHSFDSAFEINKLAPGKGSLWNSFLNISGWESTNPGAGHTAARGQTQEPFDRTFTGGQYIINVRSWWYNTGAEFARPYGTATPAEDWGTVWESLFVDAIIDDPHGAFAKPVASKVAIVNRLLDSL